MPKQTNKWRTRALNAEYRLSLATEALLRLAQPSSASGSDAHQMAGYAQQVLDSLRDAQHPRLSGDALCAVCGRRIETMARYFTDEGEPVHTLCQPAPEPAGR
jgi:hypothetical protein